MSGHVPATVQHTETMIITSADDPGKSVNYAVLGDSPIVASGHVSIDDPMTATSGDSVVVAKGDDTMIYVNPDV